MRVRELGKGLICRRGRFVAGQGLSWGGFVAREGLSWGGFVAMEGLSWGGFVAREGLSWGGFVVEWVVTGVHLRWGRFVVEKLRGKTYIHIALPIS